MDSWQGTLYQPDNNCKLVIIILLLKFHHQSPDKFIDYFVKNVLLTASNSQTNVTDYNYND